MANTEGIPDEDLHRLLSLNNPNPKPNPAAQQPASTTNNVPNTATSSSSISRTTTQNTNPTTTMSRRQRQLAKRDEAMRMSKQKQQEEGPSSSSSSIPSPATTTQPPQQRPTTGTNTSTGSSSSNNITSSRMGNRSSAMDRRLKMMDEFHPQNDNSNTTSNDGRMPSAKVIRSSRRPVVKRSSSSRNTTSNGQQPQQPQQPALDTTSTTSPSLSMGDNGATSRPAPAPSNGIIQERQILPPSAPSILFSDSIVERPLVRLPHHSTTHTTNTNEPSTSAAAAAVPVTQKRRSRFKQQQQGIGGPGNGGCPTFDFPIGSLTRKGSTTPTTTVARPPPPSSVNTSNTSAGSSSNNNNNQVAADSMLAGMTNDEIRERVGEIEDALSPETIAFLRKRGGRHTRTTDLSSSSGGGGIIGGGGGMGSNNTTTNTQHSPFSISNTNTTTALPSSSKQQQPQTTNHNTTQPSSSSSAYQKERTTKENTAKLLAGIRTETELDEAFLRAMGPTTTTPTIIGEDGAKKGEEDDDETKQLESSCRLLRSTSPQQRLLGARRVCDLLERRAAVISSSNHQETESFQYPPLLPVALRCLLDLPTPQSNRRLRLLQSYVVRSLYAAVLLFCHPDHRIWVWPSSSATSLLPLNGGGGTCEEEEEEDDDRTIYQLHCLQDAIPTPPIAECYPSTNTDANTPTTSIPELTKEQQQQGCYSTNSSAQSATTDSQAFYTDPAWTLLSRMRFLPRIATILSTAAHSTANTSSTRRGGGDGVGVGVGVGGDDGLSHECLTAICGLLSILSLRSPGAAGAIAQNEDITRCIASMTLDFKDGGDCFGDGDGVMASDALLQGEDCVDVGETTTTKTTDTATKGFLVEPKVAYPTILFLCTLARQSRTAASTITDTSNNTSSSILRYVHYILAVEAVTKEEWMVQRWSIILWRIVLKYGLGITELSTFLPRSVIHLSSTISSSSIISSSSRTNGVGDCASDGSLTVEYLSAYAAVCDCVKVARMRFGSDLLSSQYDGEGEDGSKHDDTTRSNTNAATARMRMMMNAPTRDERETLSSAGIWLASHAKLSLDFLLGMAPNTTNTTTNSDDTRNRRMAEMKTACARLKMVSSYVSAASTTSNNNKKEKDEIIDERKTTNDDNATTPTNHLKSVPVIDKTSVLDAMETLFRHGMVYDALQYTLHSAFSHSRNFDEDDDDNDDGDEVVSHEMEGTACAFVDIFLSTMMGTLLSLSSSSTGVVDRKEEDDEYERKLEAVSIHVFALIVNVLQSTTTTLDDEHHSSTTVLHYHRKKRKNTTRPSSCARMGWLNRAHLSVCRYLTSLTPLLLESTSTSSTLLPTIQSFAYSLIGRLQRGDEAMLAMLLSQDVLFTTNTNTHDNNNNEDSTTTTSTSLMALPDMMMRELCTSSRRSQVQLDHSFKLLGGYGITKEGNGLFAIGSLRSESDYLEPPPPPKKEGESGEGSDDDLCITMLLLPLTTTWLWHALSSTVRNQHHQTPIISNNNTNTNTNTNTSDPIKESIKVVVATLRLLISLEKNNAPYVCNIPIGKKLYFLLNACLYPESVIRDEEFGILLEELYWMYYDGIGGGKRGRRDNDLGQTFLKSCVEHSVWSTPGGLSHRGGGRGGGKIGCGNDNDLKKEKEDMILDDLLHTRPTKTATIATTNNGKNNDNVNHNDNRDYYYKITPKQQRAIDNFISDLCTAFLDYGAQYDHFLHCIRFLLRPEFHSKVRSDVLSKLRDIVRSLTSQSELNDLLVLQSLSSPPPIITTTTDTTKLFLKTVEGSLSGGIPTNNNRDDDDDGSKRDSAEFLDLLSSILRRSSSIPSASVPSTNGTIRKNDGNVGFFHLYAVGHLSRNLAYIAQEQRRAVTTTSTSTSLSSSLSSCSMRQRMKGLNGRTLNDIVSCATRLVQSSISNNSNSRVGEGGTVHDLFLTLVDVCVMTITMPTIKDSGGGDKREDRQNSLLKAIDDDDDAWNAMIVSLQYSDERIPI